MRTYSWPSTPQLLIVQAKGFIPSEQSNCQCKGEQPRVNLSDHQPNCSEFSLWLLWLISISRHLYIRHIAWHFHITITIHCSFYHNPLVFNKPFFFPLRAKKMTITFVCWVKSQVIIELAKSFHDWLRNTVSFFHCFYWSYRSTNMFLTVSLPGTENSEGLCQLKGKKSYSLLKWPLGSSLQTG